MENKLVIPCIRSVMGDWVFYSSVMDVMEISIRVKTDKKYRENPDLDKILQRDLKERRQNIAKYLLTSKSRFFNSIIIGVFNSIPQWHEFKIDKKLNEINGSNQNQEYNHSVGLLEFSGDEEMFAIDGQHRVAGIQIAFEQEQNKPNDEKILKDDKFPVIFIAHIDDNLGRKRTRKLFSDINNTARPVQEGDRIKVDEENLNAIVTRRIYANYEHFKNGKLISLTEREKLDSKDEDHFTNLLGINNANKILKKLFKKKPKTNEWEEENVERFYKIVKEFYDYVIENVIDYNSFFVKKKLTIKQARKNNLYLLFRPIGLKLLARLYVFYSAKKDGLEELKTKINKISFVFPDSPFNNLLWSDGKMKAREKNQAIAYEITLYIFGDLQNDKQKTLLERYKDVVGNPAITLPQKIKV
ncbi:DNA sulfur modification protein DndB [Parafilimonas terrae]|uniref:DNA sulfur modification protein DndB n=1 Tax=Parafilimonas terrae TaxID=1465490 RepID=A0A1I5VIT3_9BACT|nr:DNA sulfur modification protein DndB [Parafilimonas terrae]SFQ07478.1 DNA sulfur modification protein DndB [Parafilimonas terrae]